MRRMTAVFLGVAGLVAGCSMPSELENRQTISRPEWDSRALPKPTASQVETGARAAEGANATTMAGKTVIPELDDTIAGTWDFTVPATVTRVSRSTNDFEQALLYVGRPNGEAAPRPTDKPFLVITTRAEVQSVVEESPEDYKVKATRAYLLNGQPCKESTGYTKKGESFCELIIKRAKGDQLHAMAIATNDEQRKIALEILASIKWTAAKP